MLLVYIGFDTLVWKPKRDQMNAAAQVESVEENTDTQDTPDEEPASIPFSESGIMIRYSEETAQEYTLENDNLRVVFNSRGAVISSIELKHYDVTEGTPVDLIPAKSVILNSRLYRQGGSSDFDAVIFSVTENQDENALLFYLGEEEGEPNVLISYKLDDSYGIVVEYGVQNMGYVNGFRVSLDAGIADSEPNPRAKAQDYRFMLNADNKITKLPLSKMKKSQPQGSFGSFGWAAVRSKYFTLAIRENEAALFRSFSACLNPETSNPGFSIDSFSKDSKATWNQSYTLYAGPADAKILKEYGKQMENIAERGANWLRWLANFFAWFLNWLHGLIPNYGVVIIIFALLLKLALSPLTTKSMKTTFKMQEIQPQLNALQTKYKDNPQMLQQEMGKLYKEAGANPLSGCLPLLLQMPVFFALYSVLRYSMDMRNAGFIFWLKDLSEPDPYLVLPILMGIFMIIQSLMTQPKQGDPDQMDEKQKAAQSSQKMMTYMMPVMMFFIFKNMPAGLVLYWTVFNVFTIVHQYYLRKKFSKD